MTASAFVTSLEEGRTLELDWGRVTWLMGAGATPGAEQTFGVCTIHPGKRNPLHSHPNCEELLYVVSGSCEHRLGDELVPMGSGSVIRIPRNVPHWARCTSDEPLVCVISFSSGDRRTDAHEDAEVA
jgi:quercetin dioxygenase-like cupin family protein